MTLNLTWPNVVTIVRLAMVFLLVMLAYGQSTLGRLLAAVVAVLVVAGDWLDGYLARKLNQESALGSVLDVVADRILENVMWIILADLDLIPIWIPVVVIPRGILTDSIRNYALRFGYAGFGEKTIQKSRIGRFLTGSPLMRTPYALIKAFAFGWLLLFGVLDEIQQRWSMLPDGWIETALAIGYWAAVLSAIICVVRGIPVVIEGISLIRNEGSRDNERQM